MKSYHYPFELVPLPYAYDALVPYIDEKTMRLHHDKHLETYVNKLNAALKDYPDFHNWSLEQLLCYSDRLPDSIKTAVINNGGGVYNHNFYFANLAPAGQAGQLSGELAAEINRKFGSADAFMNLFKEKGLGVFGSGYTWLAVDKDGELQIINTKTQDTVLPMDMCPILLIDVWEHAYYLNHFNVRADYINDWFKVVNWRQAERNFQNCIKK